MTESQDNVCCLQAPSWEIVRELEARSWIFNSLDKPFHCLNHLRGFLRQKPWPQVHLFLCPKETESTFENREVDWRSPLIRSLEHFSIRAALVLVALRCDWSRKVAPPSQQIKCKLTPKATWSLDSSNSHWFGVTFCFALIGWCDYFGFRTPNWNAL